MNAVSDVVARPEPSRPESAFQWQPGWHEHEKAVPCVRGGHTPAERWDRYADQQLQILIHRIFFPAWPKPARQVVLLPPDEQTDTTLVCARLARTMAAQLPGTVCAIEATTANRDLEHLLIGSDGDGRTPESHGEGAAETANNLWVLPSANFFGAGATVTTPLQLQTRLSELRREFGYTVIHAPGGESMLGILLGQLTDGVILVVQAHVTRRGTALRIKEMLQTANARLLGVVLDGRTFPIPEAIYQRL